MHVCMSYDCTSADHLKPQSQDAYPQPHAPPQKKSFTTMYLIPCIPVQGQLKKNINVIFCVHSYSFSIRFSSSSIQYTPCRQKYGLSLSVTKQLLNKTVIQLATWGETATVAKPLDRFSIHSTVRDYRVRWSKAWH